MTLDFYELTKGAPGYGNKAVPSLDFGALTLSDNLIQGKLHFSERMDLTWGPWNGSRRPGTVRGRSFNFVTYKCNGSRWCWSAPNKLLVSPSGYINTIDLYWSRPDSSIAWPVIFYFSRQNFYFPINSVPNFQAVCNTELSSSVIECVFRTPVANPFRISICCIIAIDELKYNEMRNHSLRFQGTWIMF